MGKRKSDGENNSKSFDRDDKHGRVGRLDEQTMGYYRRISDTLEGGFDSDEEREMFMSNVFEQLCQEAIAVSQNQTASRIIETLIKNASRSQLRAFMNALATDWETACTDRFACYVTQSLIVATASYISDEDPQDDHRTFIDLLSELSGFLAGNLAFHMQHTYASHILRVVIEVTGGVIVSEKVIRSKLSRQQRDDKKGEETKRGQQKPSEKGLQLFYTLCEKVLGLMKLEDHASNHLANPILQTVVLALKARDTKRCAKACHRLIDSTLAFETSAGGDGNKIPALLSHEIGSHFIEQLICAAPEELYGEMLEKHSMPHLQLMALHPVANFVLQRIITEAHTCEQFETIYHSVTSILEDILARQHMGVVLRLAEGAIKHGTKQKKLIKALMKAFHCYSPPERQVKCAQLFASVTAYEVFYKVDVGDENEKKSGSEEDSDNDEVVVPTLTDINLHGSILLQHLVRFGNPKLVVTSLLEMRPIELKTLSCDQCGSHVIDAFMKSVTVGEKSREKIYVKLKPFLLELACSKSGSRSLDTLWHAASVKQKAVIAEQLVKSEAKLRGDRFGRFAWRNYALEHFVRRRSQWQQIQTGETKKRRMFEEIIDAEAGQPEKKKKKAKGTKPQVEDDQMQEDSSSDEVDKSGGQLNSVSTDSVTPAESQITATSDNSNANCETASKKKKKNAEDVQIDNEGVEKGKKEQIVDAEETPKTKKQKKKKKMKAAGL